MGAQSVTDALPSLPQTKKAGASSTQRNWWTTPSHGCQTLTLTATENTLVLYLQSTIKGSRSKTWTTWKIQQSRMEPKRKIRTKTRGWHMSNQFLLVKSASLSPLITVVLADVNKHMGKTLLFTGKSFKSLERTLTSIPHLTAWSTWDKYGIIASLQNLMWDKWSLLGTIKQEWFSESGNENFTQ